MQLFLMFNQGKIVLMSKIFSGHNFLAGYFLFCTLLKVQRVHYAILITLISRMILH